MFRVRVWRRRSEEAEVRLLDEAEQERRDEERRQQVQEYRAFREQVEKNREAERVERNLIKRLRLDLFEQLQVRAWRHHVTPSCLFMFCLFLLPVVIRIRKGSMFFLQLQI